MNKMLIDRSTVEQALEALEKSSPQGFYSCKCMASQHWPHCHWKQHQDAITALRAALAEPVQEPCNKSCAPGYCYCGEPVQEPVAWMYTGIKSDGTEHGPHLVWKPAYMDAMSADKGAKATPLYAAPPPPQRKPLSNEELDRLWREPMSADWEHREYARAIERAHGIGGQP